MFRHLRSKAAMNGIVLWYRDVGKSGKKSEPEVRGGYRLRQHYNAAPEAKGSTFNVKREMPSHYTVHPDWASEAAGLPKKK